MSSRWKEPPVFFFNERRQAEYEAVRESAPGDPFAEVAASIAGELPELFASVEVRRVARAIDGLQSAAEVLAQTCPAAKDLANLLAVPDDEVIVVLHPERRAGFRLAIRGIADLGQFHILLADAVTGDCFRLHVPQRFVAACRDVNPTTPAGVPMVARRDSRCTRPPHCNPMARFPREWAAADHWLWPTTALASVPRIDGERVVLLGPPAYHATWDVTRRFPAMPAELRLMESLSPFRVAERLSR